MKQIYLRVLIVGSLFIGTAGCDDQVQNDANLDALTQSQDTTAAADSVLVVDSSSYSNIVISYSQPVPLEVPEENRYFTFIYKIQNNLGDEWESAVLFSFEYETTPQKYLDFGDLKLNNRSVPKYGSPDHIGYGIFKWYLKNGQPAAGYDSIPDAWRLSQINSLPLAGENSMDLSDFSATINTTPTIRITNLVSGANYSKSQDLTIQLDRITDRVLITIYPLFGSEEQKFKIFGVNNLPSNTFVIPKAELSKLAANNPGGNSYIVDVYTGGHTGNFNVTSNDSLSQYAIPVWSWCESASDIHIVP